MTHEKSKPPTPANWNDVKKTFQSFAGSILQSGRKSIHESYETSKDKVVDTVEEIEKDARQIASSTKTYIKKNPVPFVVGALFAGVFVGLLLNRRNKKR